MRPSSGWWPALLAFAVAVLLLREYADIAVSTSLLFTAYLLVYLTFPGTVLWRWLDRSPGRALVEDLTLGTIGGYLIELPIYLSCRAAGFPRLILLWPVVVFVVAVLTKTGRGLVVRRSSRRMPWAVSWSVAAMVLFVLATLASRVWATYPATPLGLRMTYPDITFHLSMIGELRHHVPGQIPFVAGTPMDYHWLSYVHFASSADITGIDPAVLLVGLNVAALISVTVLATAVLTARLAGRWWPGPVAAGLLTLVVPFDVFGWTRSGEAWAGAGFVTRLLVLSPTYTYSTMLLVGLLLLVVEIVRGDRTSLARWVVVAVLLVAVGGAKATTLPVIVPGLVAATLLGLVLGRGFLRRPALLALLGSLAFVVDKQVFYGPGARSLLWSPLATVRLMAARRHGLVDSAGHVPATVLAVVTVSFVVAQLAVGVGGLGLLIRGGWRTPVPQMLLSMSLAAVGATILLSHPSESQLYFLHAGTVPLLLFSGLGLARLAGLDQPRLMVAAGIGGTALGVLTTWVVARLTTQQPPRASANDPFGEAIRTFVVPQLVAAGILLAFVVTAWLTSRRHGWPRRTAAMFGVAGILSLGLGHALVEVPTIARHQPFAASKRPLIGGGGIEAARWLRAHSSADTLVATNAHCLARARPHCQRKNFWISGYAERRVLVEGWAYIAPATVGMPSNAQTNSNSPPFWEPARLRANDLAFIHPSAVTLFRLARNYGVSWLFVDERSPADVAALKRLRSLIRLAYHQGRYDVFRVLASRP